MRIMLSVGLQRLCRGMPLQCEAPVRFRRFGSFWVIPRGRQSCPDYSTLGAVNHENGKDTGKTSLAKDLAFLVDESSELEKKRSIGRMERKRFHELQIKKRVKEQYVDGKFHDLLKKVIANPKTLQDAYNCIRINSNVDVESTRDSICFESLAEELSNETFDVKSNIFSISRRGAKNEILVLPNLKLKIIQESIRIVLEIVYRPHFSKISHGCRSGRGHNSALKYIRKEIHDPDLWFTLLVNKKLDGFVLAKLISTMEDKIKDCCLYAIIQHMFDAQVINLEFGGFPKGHGLPQEGVLSPILMNIYLDLFDSEFYKISMRYEALSEPSCIHQNGAPPRLRCWFRRHLNGPNVDSTDKVKTDLRVHCCRFMDEMFFAISGSKDVASKFKLEIQNYLIDSLHLDVDAETELSPCDGLRGVRFLGTLVKRNVKESPAVRVVHKLKEKVSLFASQRQEAWDALTVRIGKKWLAHGLKMVKESEIKHLADSSSVLSKISGFRKPGMKTDHWYKFLMKIWMQDFKAKTDVRKEALLSKYIVEPALPKELRESYYKFQRSAEEYIASETALTLALLPELTSTKSIRISEIIAPVNVIKKRLVRYGLTDAQGYPLPSHLLISQDDVQIIDWFSGIVRRWVRWYSGCVNFDDIKIIISDHLRDSCIRTLATKFQMDQTEVEKQFDSQLSEIPSAGDIVQEIMNEISDSQASNNNEALTYGISYSGVCLLSLARVTSKSRPCTCFVMGCLAAAPNVYTLHVMERQKFPGWKTGFASCIHPSLNKRRLGLCKQHLRDLYFGDISLQSIEFRSWK